MRAGEAGRLVETGAGSLLQLGGGVGPTQGRQAGGREGLPLSFSWNTLLAVTS